MSSSFIPTRLPNDAAVLRGHLFERQVLNDLYGLRTECTFPVRGVTDSNQTTWTYEGSTFFDEITELEESNTTAFGPFSSQLSGR